MSWKFKKVQDNSNITVFHLTHSKALIILASLLRSTNYMGVEICRNETVERCYRWKEETFFLLEKLVVDNIFVPLFSNCSMYCQNSTLFHRNKPGLRSLKPKLLLFPQTVLRELKQWAECSAVTTHRLWRRIVVTLSGIPRALFKTTSCQRRFST